MIALSEDHVYSDTETGRVYPGVTQVIKAAGLMGYQNSAPFYMERGSVIHEATALFDEDSLDWNTVDPRILPYVEAWQFYRIRECENAPYDFIEKSFVHPIYQYAGTLDRPGLDIKSGSPCAWHILQAAAYAHLSGAECSQWKTVYLQDDGRYKVTIYKVSDLYAAFKVFLAALAIYNWKKENKIT